MKRVITLPVPIPEEEEKKWNEIFTFTLLCGASKGFRKTLKAFIKPYEATQRSVKKKIKLIFILIPLFKMHGAVKVNILTFHAFNKILFIQKIVIEDAVYKMKGLLAS